MIASSLTTILAISVVAGGVYLVQHPQPIIDQVTVWQYEPPAAVAAHVTRLALTEHGRFLYYASQPQIDTSEGFAKSCPAHEGEDGYGILGCYLPADKTIFLYHVTDNRLDGTEEVTAAHEMLHAAWDRMSTERRADLASLLEAEYAMRTDDALFAERMSIYARIEPGEHANELHSIIGTELQSISPELEEYYATYFTDRSIVTSLHASANAVFVQIKSRTDELIASMDELRDGIESDYATYTSRYDQLNSDVQNFNRRNVWTSRDEEVALIAERASIIERQSSLDDLYSSIMSRSDIFDSLMEELESLNSLRSDLQLGLNIGGAVSVHSAE